MTPSPSSSLRAPWWSRWWHSLIQDNNITPLGTVWQGSAASSAFEQEELCSQESGNNNKALRLCVRNYTPLPLFLCWISSDGKPHHFYTFDPIQRGVESNVVTSDDRLETTRVGHLFLFASHVDKDDIQKKVLKPSSVVGGYRPSASVGEGDVHIVSIYPSTTKRRNREAISCCHAHGRPWAFLRGTNDKHDEKKDEEDSNDEEEYSNSDEFVLTVTRGFLDPTPIDTSDKLYEKVTIGGWPCRVEPNWHGGNLNLEKMLTRDLEYATRHLPPRIRTLLQTNTPIYINKCQSYGPKACPIDGKGLCFHPTKSWLCQNGMSVEKCECIELYNACDYGEDAAQWGPGGVVLHELAHAYHWKLCVDGYQNAEILECYQLAMKEGLYDCVSVHTRTGTIKRKKAYACTNQMEYFAELSTAFLGGICGDVEYNKWFPFCRSQIKEHDPRAYELLQKLWNVDC